MYVEVSYFSGFYNASLKGRLLKNLKKEYFFVNQTSFGGIGALPPGAPAYMTMPGAG